MAVTEEQRHDLYGYFEEAMGHERATTLMELLPPVGWGEVATKQFVGTEIDRATTDLKAEIALLRKDLELGFAGLRIELHSSLHRQLLAVMGSQVAYLGLMLAAAKVFL